MTNPIPGVNTFLQEHVKEQGLVGGVVRQQLGRQ